ncbi:hypothetical protein PR048_021776 [Dryococelus australis]|uniref:Uncharacterized protein n=1 Tax=Dryococelus australis TaxID=614101 RepID=A0ABQ9GZ51_9NEOP|nr:hypothetical protein PR048_021776 [Dryococelus australis]
MRCLILAGQSGPFSSPSGGFKLRACVISSLSECVDRPTPRPSTYIKNMTMQHEDNAAASETCKESQTTVSFSFMIIKFAALRLLEPQAKAQESHFFYCTSIWGARGANVHGWDVPFLEVSSKTQEIRGCAPGMPFLDGIIIENIAYHAHSFVYIEWLLLSSITCDYPCTLLTSKDIQNNGHQWNVKNTLGGEGLLASHQGELGSIPGQVTPTFLQAGIKLDDAAGQRVFSGILHFPHPCIPALFHTHLTSPSLTLKTSLKGKEKKEGRGEGVKEGGRDGGKDGGREGGMEGGKDGGEGGKGRKEKRGEKGGGGLESFLLLTSSSEKTCQPAASSSTIPTCKNSGVTPPEIEPDSPWWETSALAAMPTVSHHSRHPPASPHLLPAPPPPAVQSVASHKCYLPKTMLVLLQPVLFIPNLYYHIGTAKPLHHLACNQNETHRPCENLGATPPGIEPSSPRWEVSSLTTTTMASIPLALGIFLKDLRTRHRRPIVGVKESAGDRTAAPLQTSPEDMADAVTSPKVLHLQTEGVLSTSHSPRELHPTTMTT